MAAVPLNHDDYNGLLAYSSCYRAQYISQAGITNFAVNYSGQRVFRQTTDDTRNDGVFSQLPFLFTCRR